MFIKYIDENGYFAVNASFYSRQQLYQQFKFDKNHKNINEQDKMIEIIANKLKQQELNENDMYHIFDCVLREIFKLLKGSFLRFKQSEEYERLIKISVDKSDGNKRKGTI